jgi:hypothetical protein
VSEQPRNATPINTEDRSVRPVVEHALTVYFDGNADLARTLIDRLIAEARAE